MHLQKLLWSQDAGAVARVQGEPALFSTMKCNLVRVAQVLDE